jgi:hypothetical protein
MERAKNQLMGKLPETKVPTLTPELAEGCGLERRGHDGLGSDPQALPQESNHLESAEVKEKDQTRHAYPSA